MTWNSYYGAYLGADPLPGRTASSFREHRGPVVGPIVRDHRGDDRVPIPPQPQPQPQPQPDPRVTTRPGDLRPRDDDRDRDERRRYYQRHRRYREEYDLPWGQRYYGDYLFLAGYGWLPRWYPYWDPSWYDYWWYLFDYYGGDANADYAAYARDAVLRGWARQYGWL